MNAVMREFLLAAKEGPKLYFAPLRKALSSVQDELRRIRLERKAHVSSRKPPRPHSM